MIDNYDELFEISHEIGNRVDAIFEEGLSEKAYALFLTDPLAVQCSFEQFTEGRKRRLRIAAEMKVHAENHRLIGQ